MHDCTTDGGNGTNSVLSLLYPNLDFSNIFHVDHIFPKSKFTRPYLRKLGLSDGQITEFQDNVNFIGNLQLLKAIPNIEKQNKDTDKWIAETFPTPAKKKAYLEEHLIPDIDLKFANFMTFFKDREILIVNQLKAILQ